MNTKKYICKALLELMKEKKFDKITVQDIADRTEITRSTFYYHFESKYDVIVWYCNEQEKQIIQTTQGKPWYEFFLELNRFMGNNKELFRSLYLQDSYQAYQIQEQTVMKDYFRNALTKNSQSASLTPAENLTIIYAVEGIAQVLKNWIIQNENLDYREITDLCYQLLPQQIRDKLEQTK